MSRSNITPEVEAEIIRLANEGMSSRKIAKQLGIPRSTVKRRVDAYREAEIEAELAQADELEDDDDRGPMPPRGDTYAPAPFTFDKMLIVEAGVAPPRPVLDPQFIDADGNTASMLDIYQADYQDGSVDRVT